MKNITLLGSGTGTNFLALVDAGIKIDHIVCDNPDALLLEKAEETGIYWSLSQQQPNQTLTEWGDDLIDILGDPDLVVCAGFMKILPKNVCDVYHEKIINIHPSLLPKYAGSTDAVFDAYKNGDLEYGVTIHHVTEDVDGGPIILQKSFAVESNHLLSDVQKKIKDLEHEMIVEVVNSLI